MGGDSSCMWQTPAPFVPLWTLSYVTNGFSGVCGDWEKEPPLWSPELGGWEALYWVGTCDPETEDIELLTWRCLHGDRNACGRWVETPEEDRRRHLVVAPPTHLYIPKRNLWPLALALVCHEYLANPVCPENRSWVWDVFWSHRIIPS